MTTLINAVISFLVRILLHLKSFNKFCEGTNLFLYPAGKLTKPMQEQEKIRVMEWNILPRAHFHHSWNSGSQASAPGWGQVWRQTLGLVLRLRSPCSHLWYLLSVALCSLQLTCFHPSLLLPDTSFFVPRTHALERYGEGEPPKPCWGLGTYRDGRVCSDPPLPARLPPCRESEATLVVRGPPSTRSLMLLNRSPGKVGPSNAVPCFCCTTSPAERWRKDVGTVTAGLAASRRQLWHICFSCQSVRRALEVRDDGCGNSIHFKVCVFFSLFLF